MEEKILMKKRRMNQDRIEGEQRSECSKSEENEE